MQVYGFSAGIGTRLKWPDNYFVLYNGLSWQIYDLKNWINGYFMFNQIITGFGFYQKTTVVDIGYIHTLPSPLSTV